MLMMMMMMMVRITEMTVNDKNDDDEWVHDDDKTSARVIVCFDGPGGKKDYDELVDDVDDNYKIVLQCW